MFDINDLRLSEVADIERLSGQPLSAIGNNDMPKGKLLQSIVYVVKRREDPKFKFEQAGEVSMLEATTLIAGDEDDDDKSDTGEG